MFFLHAFFRLGAKTIFLAWSYSITGVKIICHVDFKNANPHKDKMLFRTLGTWGKNRHILILSKFIPHTDGRRHEKIQLTWHRDLLPAQAVLTALP
jgi:hypothetical protein